MIRVSEPYLSGVERNLVLDCFLRNQLTQGPSVAQFERELASHVGSQFAVAVTSGTTALHLTLKALGIKPFDEVLVPDVTFVATANAVRYCGATPVLVDVDPDTWTIDLTEAARRVTSRTRAIIPVHLYGVPCEMDSVLTFANEHKLSVVEDAAEGLGGSYTSYRLGSMGIAGVFSFYGNKVVTTGEGGAVVTNSEELAHHLRHLRGQAMTDRRYHHDEIGFNYRMTEMQGAVGVGQMARIRGILNLRSMVFEYYTRRLEREIEDGRVILPIVPLGGEQAPWLFTIMVQRRDRVADYLQQCGIETRPAFRTLHTLPMYWEDGRRFPNATRLAKHGLSLPTHPGLTKDQLDKVIVSLKEALVVS